MKNSRDLLAEKNAELRAMDADYIRAKDVDVAKLKVQAFDRIETICRGWMSAELIDLTFGRILEAIKSVQDTQSIKTKYERLKEDVATLSDRLLENEPRPSS